MRKPDDGGPGHEGVARPRRLAWVDCARGWCIILVVAMHSALGVGLVAGEHGWLHQVVAFAKPFRMPDFFVIAGLFAGDALFAPWRRFLDRKVLHFAYFYALWLVIALVVKAPVLGLTGPLELLKAFAWYLVEPFSSTWFIQILPIFYIVTRLARGVPNLALFGIALSFHALAAAFPKGGAYAMESALTGWTTLDAFLLFWVYFLVGVRFRDVIVAFAGQVAARPKSALAALALWGLVEAGAVAQGWPELWPFGLAFGLAGAFAVVAGASLVARLRSMQWLAFIGRHSLVIYLAFFLPMAAARVALFKVAPWLDVGTISLLVTGAAILVPLSAERMLRDSWLAFLFKRPRWARLRDGLAAHGSHRHDGFGVRQVLEARPALGRAD